MAALLCWLALAAVAATAPEGASDTSSGRTEEPGAFAVVLGIQGAIGPATSRYIEKGIAQAEERGARLVILQMDTPGGLDSAMRDIIRAILASRVPVVSYVAPSGARAASAGTYIMYASHVAAMAPATNLGAATPVAIGGEPPREPERPGTKPDEAPADDASEAEKPGSGDSAARRKPADEPMEPGSATERKAVNDAVAYIRGLAELRGRNVEWAEQAVRAAASLSAKEALAMNVIDVIARDLPDLLAQIDGREVQVSGGPVTLATRHLTIERMEPDWRTQLLSVITNPTIAYGLLLIGLYGLLLEGYNPGAIVPGVVGAISLLLALFAFQILSVNYAGLALLGLGIAMIIAEFFVPSFGALGLGGLVAFVVGSIILLDTDVPGFDVAVPLIAGVATVGGLALIGLVWLVTHTIRRPAPAGMLTMVGDTAEVFEDFTETGRVRYGGELWNAHTSVPLRAGQPVRIVKVEGLWLWVEPLQGRGEPQQ
jgi:Membrane-bound serine protease (ClpP class)|nr:MAG: serine protease [Pseudomonadota bacterium]